MKATAWNNGCYNKSGAGYGLKIRIADRDKFFKKTWTSVELVLGNSGKSINISLKQSFWKKCYELRSKEIGLWLQSLGRTNWPKRKPPKFSLEPVSEGRFVVQWTVLKEYN